MSAMSNNDKGTTVGNRIVVTGMAGAGKSTLSRLLATRTDLPLIHLDLHIWNPGWVRLPLDELLEKQRALLAGSSWIVDSNDVDDELLLQRADTLVILATPWWICSWRAFKRGLKRPAGAQLPVGCKESAMQRLGDEWGIVWRNWRHRNRVHERYLALASRCAGLMHVYVFSSKQEVENFANSLWTPA